MGQLLGAGIIHHRVVRARHDLTVHRPADLQVIEPGPRFSQIGQQRVHAVRAGTAERFQRRLRHHPGANSGAQGLGLKRSQRLVFPGLHVARRPVVQQDIAEDHVFGLLDADAFAHDAVGADDGAKFQFQIQAFAGRPAGTVLALQLPHRAADRRAGHDHGRRPPVIADGHVRPLRRQGVLGSPEQHAHVEGMVSGRIEVGVFRHPDRQVQGRIRHRHQRHGAVALLGQQRGQPGADPIPPRPPQRHETVQLPLGEGAVRIQQPARLGRCQIDDAPADGRPAARRIPANRKDAIRQVVQGKGTVRRIGAVHPGPDQRHVSLIFCAQISHGGLGV